MIDRRSGSTDDFNALDPEILVDSCGSYWSGSKQ